MQRTLALTILVALAAAACGDSSVSFGPEPATTTAVPTTTSVPGALDPVPARTADCLHPEETSFRSRWLETSEGTQGQVLREIAADAAQWIYTHPVDETGFDPDALSTVIVGDGVWVLEDGVWEEFPVVPIRRPLLAWVNGYVNGPDLVKHLTAGERDEVDGIPVTAYRGGIEAMTAAFPGKMKGREFMDSGTSFLYWVDDCAAVLKADVTIELGGGEREIALDLGLTTVYRYQYLVYDVGTEFEIVPPVPGYLPDIPPPPMG